MKTLKNCPFCGSAGKLLKCNFGVDKPYRCHCSNNKCDVKPATSWNTTKKKARKVWDRRVK